MEYKKIRKYFCFILIVVISSLGCVYGELYSGELTIMESMPTARYGLGVVSVNEKVYTVGGYMGNTYSNIVEEYNPIANIWETKASMPTARRFLGLTQVDNKIYAIGGYTANSRTNKVEVFDTDSNQWTSKTNMPTSRHFLGVAEARGKIYAIGGYENADGTDKVEEYSIIEDKWDTKASMPTARYGLGVVTVNDKIYAIGGYSSEGNYLNTVEEYNPLFNQWTSKASMPTARYGFGIAVINNEIFVIGGRSNNISTNVIEKYNTLTDKWETVQNMPIVRCYHGATEVNNKLYIVGGFSPTDGYLSTVEQYKPPQPQKIICDLQSDSYVIQTNSQFDVNIKIEGATNIYAEDFNIDYNTNLFELINSEITNLDLLNMYESTQPNIGKSRYILASNGEEKGINDTSQIMKLTFKSKDISGTGQIGISYILVADGEGVEIIPTYSTKTFTIIK